MSLNRTGNRNEKPLRVVAPDIYTIMREIFSEYNIHPYDVQATAVRMKDKVDVRLYFADAFSQSVAIQVKRNIEESSAVELRQFFRRTAENCKKQLIADYYKMMKP